MKKCFVILVVAICSMHIAKAQGGMFLPSTVNDTFQMYPSITVPQELAVLLKTKDTLYFWFSESQLSFQRMYPVSIIPEDNPLIMDSRDYYWFVNEKMFTEIKTSSGKHAFSDAVAVYVWIRGNNSLLIRKE